MSPAPMLLLTIPYKYWISHISNNALDFKTVIKSVINRGLTDNQNALDFFNTMLLSEKCINFLTTLITVQGPIPKNF